MMTVGQTSTPALRTLVEGQVWHRVYVYDPENSPKGFGVEAAEKLGLEVERIYKTLLVESADGQLANAVVAVADMLHLKRLAAALDTKRVEMADPKLAQHKTGYVLGGISPLGQKAVLPLIADLTVQNHDTIWVSGGRRGVSVELQVSDFLNLTDAVVAHISR